MDLNVAVIVNVIVLAVCTAFLVVLSIDEARKKNGSSMDEKTFRKAA